MVPQETEKSEAEAAAAPAIEGAKGGRIAVVVNGNAKSVTAEVIETLDQILDTGDLFISRRVEESEAIARTLVDRGYGTILTGGGDGTFTVVVTSVVAEARRRGAVLLASACSASARATPRLGDRGQQIRRARQRARPRRRSPAPAIRREEPLDPLRRGRGHASPFCGFGIDAEMLRDYVKVKSLLARGPLKRLAPGPLAYAVAATTRTLPGYVFKKTPHCRVINEGEDAFRIGDKGKMLGAPIRKGAVIYEGPAKVASIGAIPYYGFGFRFFPYADERPDRMQLRISTISPAAFVANFGAIWRGEYEDLETTFDYLVDDVTIEMDPATSFQIGGDIAGERARVRAKLTPPIRIVDFYAPPRG